MDKQDRTFAGKVAMITGGSRGIGYAAARAFLEAGGKVSICGVDEGRLKAAAKGLAHLGEVLAVAADVRIFDRVGFCGSDRAALRRDRHPAEQCRSGHGGRFRRPGPGDHRRGNRH